MPSPPRPPYRPAPLLVKVITVSLWIFMALSLEDILTKGYELMIGHEINPFETAMGDPGMLVYGIFQIVIIFGWLYALGTVGIAFLLWVWRARKNLDALGVEGLTDSPGWCVGWFFVPLLCFFKPYWALLEIWRASTSPHAIIEDPTAWQSRPGSPLLTAWWILWNLSNILMCLELGLAIATEGDSPPEALLFGIFNSALAILTAVLVIQVVNRIHEGQQEAHRRQIQAVQGPTPEPTGLR